MLLPNDTDQLLQEIIAFAARAHDKQVRKYEDAPYIVHPVRVMRMCRDYGEPIAVLAAAILHDVLEDTSVKRPELTSFLCELFDEDESLQIVHLVVELTDIYTKEKYPKWNRKKRRAMEVVRLSKTSPAAQTVKYADVIDNCRSISQSEDSFAAVYLKESDDLLQKMDKGNPELYRKALETVTQQILSLK